MHAQFVIFELEHLNYAVPIERVNEVTESKDITPLPSALSSIEGVVNLRGEIIPIISLRNVLGFPKHDTTHDTKPFQIMVINANHHSYGVIIDQAKDVKSIAESDITPLNALIANASHLITSTINLNDEIIQVISIDDILNASCFDLPSDTLLLQNSIPAHALEGTSSVQSL